MLMESIELQRIRRIAENYDKKLLASDKRFSNHVHIIHQDGSILSFNYAFCVQYYDQTHGDWGATEKHLIGKWLIIFTEHHGVHIYALSDLYAWWMLKEVKIPTKL